MANVTLEQMKSQHDGFGLTLARAKPAGARKGGVVVIQEIFGVSDHIKDMCSFFADNGYEAVAPSLYDRFEKDFTAPVAPEGFEKGRAAVGASPLPQVAADIQTTINMLGAGPIYITGFCYGGAMSWLAAARLTGLKAASGFYGGMIAGALLGDTPKIPTILHYGATDPNIPQSDIDKVHAAHPDVPIYVYADAGHGFCRKGSSSYHEPSAKLGLQRTLDHFAANT